MSRPLSWACAQLTAQHYDQIMGEGLHEHVWTFTVFWPSKPWRDLRVMRVTLEEILGPFQGTILPSNLWSTEALCQMIMGAMGVIVGVKGDRPSIGGAGVGTWR